MELLWQTENREHHWPLLSPGNAILPFPWPISLLIIINSLHVWQLSSSVFCHFLFHNLPQKSCFPLEIYFFLGELSQIHIFKHHLNYRSPDWPPVLQITFYWSTATLVHCYGCFLTAVAELSICNREYVARHTKTFTIQSFNRKFADIDLEYDWLHKAAEDGWKFNMSKAKFI